VNARKLVARRPMPGFGTPVAPEKVIVPALVCALIRRSDTDALATNATYSTAAMTDVTSPVQNR
jgi:hypothetical protein